MILSTFIYLEGNLWISWHFLWLFQDPSRFKEIFPFDPVEDFEAMNVSGIWSIFHPGNPDYVGDDCVDNVTTDENEIHLFLRNVSNGNCEVIYHKGAVHSVHTCIFITVFEWIVRIVGYQIVLFDSIFCQIFGTEYYSNIRIIGTEYPNSWK